MNKKGFTLVELLAVVIVLAIILAIAVPAITGLIDNSKRNSFEASAKLMIKAVQLKLMENSNFDIYSINKNNIESLLNVDSDEYSAISFLYDANNKVFINALGTGKWSGLTASGTYQTIYSRDVVSIPTDSLVLNLDASNSASYPGTGGTWFDVSGLNNNCVWNIAPYYNARGYFEFNGTNNSGTITNNPSLDFSNAQTLIMVLRHNYTSGRKNPWDQAYAGYGTWTHENGNTMSQYFGDGGSNNSPYIGVNSPTTDRDVWNVIGATRNLTEHKWFLNGVLKSTTAHTYGTLTATTLNITIGSGYAGVWKGDMAYVLAYNRALSDAEMMQVFNAIRGRFGL